jgi:YesN/AraC family two-component response regulator
MKKSEDGYFGCEQLIRLNIEMLLISLIRSNQNKRIPTVKKHSTILAEITDYLVENVENKVTFNDVVKRFNLSPSVLKKIFREQVGGGVMDYFTRLKIDHAKEMIREEKYNFTEISEKLEFNNSQYFTTVFKRVSGMTPSEYAKSVVSKSK